jgi:hypothetical protein
MLQLPVGGRRDRTSCQLLRLQARKGGNAEEEEATGNTQKQDWRVFSSTFIKLSHSLLLSEAR